MINLPDPPDLTAWWSGHEDDKLKELVQYMDYIEGIASDLPRALYVHGSGQEIIDLEHMD